MSEQVVYSVVYSAGNKDNGISYQKLFTDAMSAQRFAMLYFIRNLNILELAKLSSKESKSITTLDKLLKKLIAEERREHKKIDIEYFKNKAVDGKYSLLMLVDLGWGEEFCYAKIEKIKIVDGKTDDDKEYGR